MCVCVCVCVCARACVCMCACVSAVLDTQPAKYTRCITLSSNLSGCRLRLKCDGICAETRFRLSEKRTSPFISAGTSVQSTTGSRGVRISGSNARWTTFRSSVKGTGYTLHSPVSPSLPLPRVTVCHHISPGDYHIFPHYLINCMNCREENVTEFKMRVLIFLKASVWNIFSLRRIPRDVATNVCTSSFKVLVILARF
jgi:hypothetical protein